MDLECADTGKIYCRQDMPPLRFGSRRNEEAMSKTKIIIIERERTLKMKGHQCPAA
jgi:hypothetical protein